MEKEGTKIWLQSGTTDREDHNCLWWLKGTLNGVNYENLGNESAIAEFETKYNARVLGTWGHDATYATRVAAVVEFFPQKEASNSAPQRATPKSIVMQRRGTAIANGVGAYTWSSTSNANTQDRNVARLTTGILEYLTPVMVDDMYTGVDEIEAAESQNQKPVYYNLQGLRVDNPSGGIFIEVRGSHTRKVVL